jgi:hypothetical protein
MDSGIVMRYAERDRYDEGEAAMYTEELRMSTRAMVLLSLPFAFTVAALAVLLILLPIPLAGQIPILGALLLEAVIGALLVACLSRIRITVDDTALTVAFRILFRKRLALDRIVTCVPTDARVWAISYRAAGARYRGGAGPRRAVSLTLTNGAQMIVGSRHPDALCAEIRARRPEMARAAGFS